jgi:hypothetical protein
VHPDVVGEVGQVRGLELDDVSSRPKAATCRRTPKGRVQGRNARKDLGMFFSWGEKAGIMADLKNL